MKPQFKSFVFFYLLHLPLYWWTWAAYLNSSFLVCFLVCFSPPFCKRWGAGAVSKLKLSKLCCQLEEKSAAMACLEFCYDEITGTIPALLKDIKHDSVDVSTWSKTSILVTCQFSPKLMNAIKIPIIFFVSTNKIILNSYENAKKLEHPR